MKNPSGEERRRAGVVDIGTNSVLLLVAERSPGGPLVPVLETGRITRLGDALDPGGRLSGPAVGRTVEVCARMIERAREAGADEIVVVATEAVRAARNAAGFVRRIERLGVPCRLLSPEEEARLSFLGMRTGMRPEAEPVLMVDIGGGSTELILGEGTEILAVRSLPFGCIRIPRSRPAGTPDLLPSVVREDLKTAARELPAETIGAMVASGGSVTTLAALVLHLRRYDPARVQGTRIRRPVLAGWVEHLRRLPPGRRAALPGMARGREESALIGAAILLVVMDAIGAAAFRVSVRALRYGVAAGMLGGDPCGGDVIP